MLVRQHGFTLIESVMVIVITGIIAAAVAVFVQRPVEGYFASMRRAELADAADAALNQMGRELRYALPNSMRVMASGGRQYLEFVPTLAAGRYRYDGSDGCFSAAQCSSLTSLGSVISANNEQVGSALVIFNYYNNSGGDCSASQPSVYCGQNRASITASSEGGSQDLLQFAPTRFYPAGGSPERRFQIAASPVSYVCDPALGLLLRYSGYGWQANQPSAFGGGAVWLMADRASACAFAYQAGAYARQAVVALQLALSDSGESVALYHQIHVDDSP